MRTYETDHIFLRKIKVEDINERFMSWFEDEELMQFYTNSKKTITKEVLLQSIEQGEANNNSFTYGIFYKETGNCIGTVKVGPINLNHRISDLPVLLGDKNYHGKGLAVEAIKLGNKLAFEEHDIRKLFGGMYESNISSIKAYTRAGWIIEGRLKGHYLVEGKAEDRILVGCFNPNYFTKDEIKDARYNDTK